MRVGLTLLGPVHGFDAVVRLPPSKSLTNRALIAATAAGGGVIGNPLECDDTAVLVRALKRCGWEITWPGAADSRENHEDGRVVLASVGSRRVPSGEMALDLGNSGTGSRFLLALLAAIPGRFVVDGSARLRERPMGPLVEALDTLGGHIGTAPGMRLPATIEGRQIAGGRVTIRPGVSSQFVSALMMMAPLTKHGLEIEIEGGLPSRPYLDLTVDVLRAFGADIEPSDGGRVWRVAPGGLRPNRFDVEADWSAAAFFLAAAAVAGGTVTVGPLDRSSAQGDRMITGILERAGVRMAWNGRSLTASGPLRYPFEADLGGTPDLFPALAVVATAGPPGSRLIGLENLRFKESDRLRVMTENLRRLGATIDVGEGTFTVRRAMATANSGIAVTSAGDHRVAMAMALAALWAGSLSLDDAACVSKSFPGFWHEWRKVIE